MPTPVRPSTIKNKARNLTDLGHLFMTYSSGRIGMTICLSSNRLWPHGDMSALRQHATLAQSTKTHRFSEYSTHPIDVCCILISENSILPWSRVWNACIPNENPLRSSE